MIDSVSQVDIQLAERSYPIHIGAGLLGQPQLLQAAIRGRQVLIVTNETIAPLYLEQVRAALAGYQLEIVILPDGEQYKDIAHWQRVIDRLIAMTALRDVALIALGGGVVGDLTGFAAASYMRGVDFIQLPTTLLAQVDAAVGGKTAVNHPHGKNLIGAFHQPSAVLIDTETLATLPPREFRAGLAEVLKYGLIRDAQFFAWLKTNRHALLDQDTNPLRESIERCCRHKAEVVATDERESGSRALLNLGHTFGHAIETASGFGRILHGEAVAIGTCLAADLSVHLQLLSQQAATEIADVFELFDLPTTVPTELAAGELVDLMKLDKKNAAGRIRLVLLKSIGEAVLQDAPDASLLRAVINGR